MGDFFQNKKNNIIDWINGLSNKQKLIYSIFFVLILIFIVKVIFGVFFNKEQKIIDYNDVMSGNVIQALALYTTNDEYVKVKYSADKFIELCLGEKYTKKGKKIDINKIYQDVLYSEYRDFISKGKFKNSVAIFKEKVNKIKSNNGQLIPESILKYKENFYIVEYSYIANDENISIWLGITLDKIDKLYYIWYIE